MAYLRALIRACASAHCKFVPAATRVIRCVCVMAAEGIDEVANTAAQLLLQPFSATETHDVRGLLIHGMGGIGKTELLDYLIKTLNTPKDSQLRFPGGVLNCAVPRLLAVTDKESALMSAQRELLQCLSDCGISIKQSFGTVAQGRELLRDALHKQKAKGSVLIVVDGVPEFGSGIDNMLPSPLTGCLADG